MASPRRKPGSSTLSSRKGVRKGVGVDYCETSFTAERTIDTDPFGILPV